MKKLGVAFVSLLLFFATVVALEGAGEKVCVKLYGYVKLDASYDTRWINAGNFARWVENVTADNSYLNITARQTRLGLVIPDRRQRMC